MRKQVKVIIMSFIIVCIGFTYSFADTKADHLMTRDEYDGGYHIYKEGVGDWYEEIQTKLYLDKKTAFCLQPMKASDKYVYGFKGANFSSSGYSKQIRDDLSMIVYCGWEMSDKTIKDYLATKFMVWERLGWHVKSMHGTLERSEYEKKKAVIKKRMKKTAKKPSFHDTTYSVFKGDTLTIEDKHGVLSGIKFIADEDKDTIKFKGNTITKKGNTLRIQANGSSFKNGDLRFKAISKRYVGSSIVYFKNSDYQKIAVFKVKDPIYSYMGLEVKEVKGKIRLKKFNNNEDKLLYGATYEIRDAKGKVVDTIVSSSKGFVYSKELPLGTYKIREVKAPKGYVISDYVWTRTLKRDGDQKVVYAKAINAHDKLKKGTIVIHKKDKDTRKDLEGAVYEIRGKKSGKLYDTLITDENGYAKSKVLYYGVYTLKEIKAPKGYILEPKVTEFVIDGDDAVIQKEYEFTNEQQAMGKIKIQKKDALTKEAIAGVEFEILDQNNAVIQKLVTDGDGVAMSDALELGKYIVRESKSAKGYYKEEKEYKIELKEDSENKLILYQLDIENTQIQGKIRIKKQDASTQKSLKGAVFVVKNSDGKEVCELVTNEEGFAESELLHLGHYTLEEKKAPVGYVLDTTKHEIDLFSDASDKKVITYNVSISNKKITSPVEITKVDFSTGEAIADCKISIYKKSGEFMEAQRTNEQGVATFKSLEYGDYYYLEEDAPEGYLLNSKKHHFQVRENGEIIKSKLADKKINAKVEILKIDSETKKGLTGCKIEIRDKRTNEVVYVGVTESDGKLDFDAVYGEYYYKEIEAPKGYILSKEVGEFIVDGTVDVIKLEIANKKEPFLPETGVRRGFYNYFVFLALVVIARKLI